jgi:hypothetical protein
MTERPARPSLSACLILALVTALAIPTTVTAHARAQTLEPRYYDIGAPTVRDIWVDPSRGDDGATGASRSQALRTIIEAWNRIPAGGSLSGTGYRILLTAGTYGSAAIPHWQEGRHGTRQFPVIIQGADGRGRAVLASGLNVKDCTFMYLIDFDIVPDPGAECLHNELCYDFLVRGMTMNGGHRAAQESLKVNQCQRYYVEDCDISSSWNVPLDFMCVQYGHVVGSRIHDAGDWCMYFKGGSAYITAEGNELYDADNGGFSAGDGSGFEYMRAPWLHYDCYDIKFVNNIVHDTAGAGIGANGGYNILFAYNTLYRVGSRSHAIEIAHGTRSCDGDAATCASNLSQGGWGTTGHGGEYLQPIPDRHVYIYDNVIYNPSPFASQWSHFDIEGPRTPAAGSNIPSPSLADDDLRVMGNFISNGRADLALGIEDPAQGGQPSNPTCNATRLRADNSINRAVPQLADPAAGDFAPRQGGNLYSAVTYVQPSFPGGDRPSPPVVPAGNLDNTVNTDFYGNPRTSSSPPGAVAAPPAYTRYFAEGYTGAGFTEYLCVGNPGTGTANVSITYVFSDGSEQQQSIDVAAGSRSTVNVNDVVGAGREVSLRVTSDRQVVVERPMYFDYKGMTGGHVTAGAGSTSKTWYFAEGYTGPGFDDYVCVLNPASQPAKMTFVFQTESSGEVKRQGLEVRARSRATFKVNDLLGADQECSLEVDSDTPVVCERPMYFDYRGMAERGWTGGHCVVGAPGLSASYLFAEGTTRAGFDEWLTLQNAGGGAIDVKAAYDFAAGQGSRVEKTYTVPAGHRRTVFVPHEVGTGKDVSVSLTSASPFLAERPMYFDYAGSWDGGHCVIGSAAARADWFFAEGYTGLGFDEWLCLWNPGASAVDVQVLYFTQEAGALPARTVTLPGRTRLTIKVNDHAGPGFQLSARARSPSGKGFVAERPMYFDFRGMTGGHDALGQ